MVIVNPSAGSAPEADDELRTALTEATFREIDDPGSMRRTLERAVAEGATAIGVAGGDGSVSTAAAVAAAHRVPLMVVPGGTLNHFARDIGVVTIDDAVTAVRAGTVVEADVARAGDHTFVNTLSIGCYPELVDRRDALRPRLGKWPAALVAAIAVLARAEPISLEIDGRPRRVWSLFVGNCRYDASPGSPLGRPRLDDGTLDVRLLPADVPLAKVRAIVSALAKRVERSPLIERWSTTSLRVRSSDGELRVARDGETFDLDGPLEIVKNGTRAAVFAPWPPEGQLTRGSGRSVSTS